MWGKRSKTEPKTEVDLYSESLGSGDPVIMVHGFGATLYSWRHFMVPLSETHRAIAIDLKGFGGSPKPVDSAYTVNDQVDALDRFIKTNDLSPVILCGHSYGGAVVLRLALRMMDRDPSELRGLIIIAGAAYPQPLPAHMKFLKMPGLSRLSLGIVTPELQVKMVLQSCFHDHSLISDEMVRAYAAPMKSLGNRHAMVRIVKDLTSENNGYFALDYRRITAPALLIWGRYDNIIPVSAGERLQWEMPNSRLEIMENCGHVPPEEMPDETLAVIQPFLAGL